MPINRVVLAANLGRDPELREVGENKVCSFSLPLTTKKRGERTTFWFQVSAWNRLGELCYEYLSKGQLAVVDGLLQVREYEKDGEKRQVLEIRATDVQFGPKAESSQGAATGGDDEEPMF